MQNNKKLHISEKKKVHQDLHKSSAVTTKEEQMNHFKALFLVGGPGSGKDFLIHSTLNEFALKEVSMERVFNAIVKETNIEELENFPSIIVNGNADNKDKVIVTKAILEEMGYDTAMIYVYTSDESSKSRNDFRIARGAKTFSESVRQVKYNSSVANMNEFLEIFENFVIYDNSNNFITVNEEKKQEITSWLTELTETVSGFLSRLPVNESAVKWIMEKQDKVVLGPKYSKNAAHPEKEGDKYTGGGVASADRNATEKPIPEQLKITQHHVAVKHGDRKITPAAGLYNVATTGAGGTTMQDTGGGVQIGAFSESKKKIPTGENGASPQSFSGITELKKKTKTPSTRGADPGEIGGKEGGVGSYVPSVGGIQEKVRTTKYGRSGPPSGYGVTADFGSGGGGAANGTGYKVSEDKKKKLKKFKDDPNTSALTAVGNENEMGQASLTSLSPSTNESKSFEQFRNRIISNANNFDKELEE
jgi:hypothetical protein